MVKSIGGNIEEAHKRLPDDKLISRYYGYVSPKVKIPLGSDSQSEVSSPSEIADTSEDEQESND